MALVIVLAIVALASVVGISFFVHVTANRKIESSRANRIKTDMLAQSAGNYVINQFLQEITGTDASSKTTLGKVSIYAPLTQSNAVPRRLVSTNILDTDRSFSNLIRQSINQTDVSADNTATPSKNERVISLARWNAPILLSGSGFTAANQIPNWIYIHRLNGATATPSTETIGRFAYNVYDIGGLLDANVAGHPTVVAGSAAIAKLKDTIAGADLTQLNVIGSSIDQPAIDKLTSFRNAAAVASADSFSNWVNTSGTSGFLFPLAGSGVSGSASNSAFFTRQDLLRYVHTQNIELTEALPYLTHFTRSVNAPSWGPTADAGTGFAYLSDANKETATNRFLPNVRFLTSGIVRHYADDGTYRDSTVSVGDILLQRRFSLNKLAWLTHNGPLEGISTEAIKACFGLRWDPSGKKWEYVANTSTLQSSIKTLGEVAKEIREPNFLELLQAGILRGSLGKSGYSIGSSLHGYSQGGITGYERNTALQIARIAANIIDQYDSDSYPTALSIGGTSGLSIAIYGIEDLPYFNKIVPVFYWPNGPDPWGSSACGPPLYNYLTYEIWNPHQPSDSSARPTQFRIRIVPGATYGISYKSGTDANVTWRNPMGGYATNPAYQQSLSDVENANMVFLVDSSSSDTQKSYREPHLVRTGVGNRITTSMTNTLLNADAVRLLTVTDPDLLPVYITGGKAVSNNIVSFSITRGVFALDYLDEDGAYRPYTTFLGQEEDTSSGWGGNKGEGNTMGTTQPRDMGLNATGFKTQGIGKIDPRSYRFDASYSLPPEYSLRPGASYTSLIGWLHDYPEFFGTKYDWKTPAPIGLLARNKLGSDPTIPVSYPDVDGVTRPADGFHGDCNPYLANDRTARPKILNRPFQSVAELGYIFRDQPFKTLDFFSADSPDAALLDIFSIRDEPLIVAGKINLATSSIPILKSLLSGASDVTNAGGEAVSFQSYINETSTSPNRRPITAADLANYAFSFDPEGNISRTKIASESPVRALGGPLQTRTWNLMIDVVAQAGRFSSPSTGTMPLAGNQFVVEGERRYWVFIAIDRYTAIIVDQQWETVSE